MQLPNRGRYIVIILLLIAHFGKTQVLVQPIPPAPTAAALGKYGETPVSLYTGAPQINIPLWQVSEGDIKVPVSLSYQATGIRVEDNPSWVGLGWSLNAGGVITRSVRGIPDERGYFINPVPPGSPSHKIPAVLLDPGDLAANASLCTMDTACEFADAVSKGGYDSEPDLYFFNFNGISGKFVMDQNGVAYTIPFQKISIHQQADQSWVIITADGMKYTFAAMETTITSGLTYAIYGGTSGDPGNAQPAFVSSWYLSKIESPTGRTVTFSYVPESYTLISGESQDLTIPASGSGTSGPFFPSVSGTQMQISGQRLASINYSTGVVTFDATVARTDLSDYTNPNLLSDITVSNSNGVIKKFLFNTDYFISTDAPQSYLTRRLRLNSVTECDASGNVCKPPYQFIYDVNNMLPSKVSASQDHWGYYNGKTNVDSRGNPTLLPTINLGSVAAINERAVQYGTGGNFVSDYNQNFNQATSIVQYAGADRAPDFNYAKACILSKIIYPTGGFTTFQYEQNDFALQTPIHSTVSAGGSNIVSDNGGDTPPSAYNSGTTAYIQTFDFRPADYIPADQLVNNQTVNENISFSFNNGGQNAYCCGCTLPFAYLEDLTTGTILIEVQGRAGYPPTYDGTIANGINNQVITAQGTFTVEENGGQVVWNTNPYFIYSGIPLNPTHTYEVRTYAFDCKANACETSENCGRPSSDLPSFAAIQCGFSYQTSAISQYNSSVGGIRIKKVLDYSNLTAPIVKQYSYTVSDTSLQSSGVILDYPIYYDNIASNTTIGLEGPGGIWNNLPFEGVYDQSINSPKIFLTSGSKFQLGQTNGSFVGYSTVQESLCQDSLSTGTPLGKTIYKYTSGNSYTDINSRAFGQTFLRSAALSDCASLTRTTLDLPFDMLWVVPTDIFPTDNVYPYPPKMSYDWKRGLLLSREDYTSNNVLQKKVENTYNLVTDANNSQIIPAVKIVVPANGDPLDPDFGAYSILAAWNYQNGEKTTEIDASGNQLVTTRTFYYDNPAFAQMTRQQYIDSKSDTILTTYSYANDLASYASTGQSNIYDTMVNRNMIGMAIETQKFNNSKFYQSSINNYGSYGSIIAPQNIQTKTLNFPLDTRIQFYNYDGKGNLLEQGKTGDKHSCYLWDYSGSYPIASVDNATQSDIAYTSFEADGTGGWSITGGSVDNTRAITGRNSYQSGTIAKSGLNPSTTYIVSYWSQNGSYNVSGSTAVQGKTVSFNSPGWTFYIHKVTGQSTISVNATGHIDELRLYPVTAQMVTYTYDPLIGMTSQMDAGNRATYYEYDGLQRLTRIRDQDYNILKTIEYAYQAPAGCGNGCYSVAMQTWAGTNTLSYPVGVFDIHGKLLGNAATPAAYVSLWNNDTADARVGTLALGQDSMHFNLSVNAGQPLLANVTGLRYFQVDMNWNVFDAVRQINGAYIDFGDGTGIRMASIESDTPAIHPPNTDYISYTEHVYHFQKAYYYPHYYPDTSLKTITCYHNDTTENSDFDNWFSPASSLIRLRNLRGYLPQHTNEIGGSCYQNASMTNLQGILNWNSITSVLHFRMWNGDGANPCLNISYPQDFMAGNKGLIDILTWNNTNTGTPIGIGDTSFRLSRLKSDWNTYFLQLQAIWIRNRDWNHEDLSHLTQLNTFGLIASDANGGNQLGGPYTPIDSTEIDNIINQISSGAGQSVHNGLIQISTGGSGRTSASQTAVNQLNGMGWTVSIDGVVQVSH